MNTINEISLAYLILFFSIYSFLGWLTEVIYAYHNNNTFINRGFLYGPFCPIYGLGIILIIFLLNDYKNNLPLLFLLGILLTSSLEYITGFILEKSFKTKWWDYSDEPYNLQGRICISFSILWGIASIFIVSIVHPIINKLINLLSALSLNIFAIIFTLYFIIDFSFTLFSLIKFNSILTQLYKIKSEFTSKMATLKTTATDDMETQLKVLKVHYNDYMLKIHSNHFRLIKAFPNIKFTKDIAILKEIKEYLLKNKYHK